MEAAKVYICLFADIKEVECQTIILRNDQLGLLSFFSGKLILADLVVMQCFFYIFNRLMDTKYFKLH